MDKNTTQTGNGVISLMANGSIMEMFAILKENGKNTSGLTALINHVSGMEDFVKQAENRIAEMKTQLDTMKEVQDHPIKTAMQKTITALEAKVAEIKANIAELKLNIIEGCKNGIGAFKEKGAAALDKLASFFKIKNGLNSIKNNAVKNAENCDKACVKIRVFSKEYHTANRALKNMARIAVGKKPIDAIKESGKLVKVFSAPYKAQKSIQNAIGKQAGKMIAALEKLGKSVEANRNERPDKPKKPNLIERLNAKKKEIKERELDSPVKTRAKTKGAEI